MPRYDASAYDPPAPVAAVSLRHSGSAGPTITGIHLLIDTGADVTLLPRSAVVRLGVQPESAGDTNWSASTAVAPPPMRSSWK